jgi:molybdopterin molybdotransferase
MVTVQQATGIILQNCYLPHTISVPVTEATGRVLAENITGDRDFPPFDRVTMDGIAIAFESFAHGRKQFLIEDTQAAGQQRKKLRSAENAIEVMTGAILPDGTDTVIRYEDLTIKNATAMLNVDVRNGQNVHRQGQDAKQGQVLLASGTLIGAPETALLATVGKATVKVLSFPRTAIISTGDELVSVDSKPEQHQIRRSNSYAIQAAMRQMSWPGEQYHLPDEKDKLRDSLKTLLAAHDVLILSGGVSKGKFDFVPDVLEEIGVTKLFHEVSQRPGKPFWFGRSNDNKTIFALPGNPVSTFMCFQRYIKPWLAKSFALTSPIIKARLAEDFIFEPTLTFFLQVSVKNKDGELLAYPRPGGGSGDFANLKDVDGFLELPLERTQFKAGEAYSLIAFR